MSNPTDNESAQPARAQRVLRLQAGWRRRLEGRDKAIAALIAYGVEIKHTKELGRKSNYYVVNVPCLMCWKSRWVRLRHTRFPTCVACHNKELAKRDSDNFNWKGGHTDSYGYIRLMAHDRDQRYILQHRVVMEQHIGRRLERHEIVHHKNGVRNDNRIENLELWIVSHPRGWRLADYLRGLTTDELNATQTLISTIINERHITT